MSSVSAITHQFKEKIRLKIQELERRSSLEIVPMIVHSSADYQGIRSSLSLGTGFITYATLTFAHLLTPSYCLMISIGCAALMALLLTRASILRFMIPRKIMLLEVEHGAHLGFLQEEIFNTQMRTGILIYISQVEKAVYVLADRGVSAKVSQGTWVDLGVKLAKDFQSQTPGETFLQAIDELSSRLAADFPPHAADENELSDDLREGRGPLH